MSLFDPNTTGCKICGKTEDTGCDCWKGYDDPPAWMSCTLNDEQWNIVLLSLGWTAQELGDACPHAATVRRHIVEQLKGQGKKFA